MLGWLLRGVFLVLILRLIWRFVSGLVQGVRGAPSGGRRTVRGGALERDPVCGTYVEPGRALTAHTAGKTHYFCSKQCLRTFRKTA